MARSKNVNLEVEHLEENPISSEEQLKVEKIYSYPSQPEEKTKSKMDSSHCDES